MAEEEDQEGENGEAGEAATPKEAPKAVEQKSNLVTLIIILLIVFGGFGATFVYLDGKVQHSVKELDRVWADKQHDRLSAARQRMYDTSQSHLQTEMMDRWRRRVNPNSKP